MTFTVTKIIDGDTFEVTPGWKWNNEEGSIVRALGYDTPEKGQMGHDEAANRLKQLINGKNVELKNPVKLTYGRLLCDVYINGKNIASYFKKYKI